MPACDAPLPARVARAAMVARWKPVHLGHAAVLEGLVGWAGHALVGIGSANVHDARNPFTAAETADMIRLVLGDRASYTLVEVPDLGNGPRWRAMVREMFGPLDAFVTANDYVASLLAPDYDLVHPVRLVPPERRVKVTGTAVREAMARGGDGWRALVPPAVAAYLVERGLVARFRREFGLATLAAHAPGGGERPAAPQNRESPLTGSRS